MSIFEKIDKRKVVAVLVVDKIKHISPLIESLLIGGVNCIELTLRTSVALEAGEIIKKNFPDVCLGFGTVLTKEQVKAVKGIGADFAVAPGCNPTIIREANKLNLPFSPGIMTPSDIEVAVQEGCKILKYFPAETSGGLKNLQSMSAPYQYLDLKFIPLGGINISNAKQYLDSSLITAIGGSWIAKRNIILDEQWALIQENATQISALIKGE